MEQKLDFALTGSIPLNEEYPNYYNDYLRTGLIEEYTSSQYYMTAANQYVERSIMS